MPAFTNYTNHFHGTLDHLFYNKDQLKLTHLLEMPDQRAVMQEKRGLPSSLFSSDHLRIEAVFELI